MTIVEYPDCVEKITRVSLLPDLIPVETLEEEEVEYKKPRDYRERDFEDELCSALDRIGTQYERQKKIPNGGIIDIFIYGQPPQLWEVKPFGSISHLIRAAAQLNFYSMCFKDCKLYVIVPEGIDPKYLPILNKMNVWEMKFG